MDPSQQEAFEDYMLGGKGKKPPSVKIPSPSISSPKKKIKWCGPIFKAFQGRAQEWKDLDGQLYQVLNSIVNLRNRIWWEKKNLDQAKKTKPWSGSGYRTRNHSLVLPEDVEMAFSHDLLQHERMLSGARTLITSMAQAQEAMGRRLDEFFNLEDMIGVQGRAMLDQSLQVYHFLGEELYRKQVLVSKMIDSCHDGLVDEASSENLEQNSNPRNVARKCYSSWSSRGEKKEEWFLVDEFLSGRTNF